MDRFSTRLAGSIIADRHREAATARRFAATTAPTANDVGTRESAAAARRILQQLGRPFGLRPAR